METDHILTEMISEKTAFNKIHLGQEIRRRIAAKDAQLKNTESLVAQLTEEVAYGNKVIAEKDAQLKVAIEALKQWRDVCKPTSGLVHKAIVRQIAVDALNAIGVGDE